MYVYKLCQLNIVVIAQKPAAALLSVQQPFLTLFINLQLDSAIILCLFKLK